MTHADGSNIAGFVAFQRMRRLPAGRANRRAFAAALPPPLRGRVGVGGLADLSILFFPLVAETILVEQGLQFPERGCLVA